MPLKSIQQFMIASACTSEAETAKVLEAIKAAGYDAIELCSFLTSKTSFAVRALTKLAGMPTGKSGDFDWKVLLADSGLACSSYHADLGSIERDPAAVAAAAHAFGTDDVVLTAMYRFDYADAGQVHALAERLNAAGEALAAEGCRFSYHNHSAEFLRVEGKKRSYDILIDETDPALVSFELDTYWAADCGMDAVALMRRLAESGRLRLWHMNDRRPQAGKPGSMMTPMLKADACELGQGCMPLDGLMKIALAANVYAVILEQHKNWIEGSPVKSLQESSTWLNAKI